MNDRKISAIRPLRSDISPLLSPLKSEIQTPEGTFAGLWNVLVQTALGELTSDASLFEPIARLRITYRYYAAPYPFSPRRSV